MQIIKIKLDWLRPKQYGYFEGEISYINDKYNVEALLSVEVEEELGGRQHSTIDVYETYIYDINNTLIDLQGAEYDDIIDELKENIRW